MHIAKNIRMAIPTRDTFCSLLNPRQLDQLDRLLDDLESKRDRIHLQARELLEDSRQVGIMVILIMIMLDDLERR